MAFVRCPKCDFQQPSDQYCAQCGIDMLSYRPSRDSFRKRLLASSVFHLFLLIALVLGSATFVYEKLRNNSNVEVQSDAVSTAASAPPSSTSSIEPLRKQVMPTSARQAPQSADQNSALIAQESAPATTETDSVELRVRVISVPSVFLTVWYPAPRTGQLNILNFTNQEDLLQTARAKTNLPTGNFQTVAEKSFVGVRTEPVMWSVVTDVKPVVEGEVGFHMKVDPLSINRRALELRIETETDVLETQDQRNYISRIQMSEMMILPQGETALVWGFFPRKSKLSDLEKTIYPQNAILKVFSTPQFITAPPRADLAFLIEAR